MPRNPRFGEAATKRDEGNAKEGLGELLRGVPGFTTLGPSKKADGGLKEFWGPSRIGARWTGKNYNCRMWGNSSPTSGRRDFRDDGGHSTP
jgi:hypothetical protein